MANIINADDGSVSGIAGIKQTADSSGALVFQANGVNAISISNTAVVTVASSISGNGAGLTNINASNISSGTVATARLASGTANSSTYLRGDQTWSTVNSSQWTTTGSDIYYNTGNVGIGTTAPATKLEVNGTGELLRLDGSTNQNRQIYFRNVGTGTARVFTDGTMTVGSNAAYPVTFITQDSERMRITSGGNVGIGNTSPYDILTVSGGASGSYGLSIDNAKEGGGVKAIYQFDRDNGLAVLGSYASNGLSFKTLTGGTLTEYMRINTSGNVGIGTSSPGVRLDVVGGTIRSLVSGGTPIVYLNNGTTQHSIQNNSGVLGLFNDGTNVANLTNAGLFQMNSGYGSVATAYGTRLWVNFNGSNGAIRGSAGVSSVSKTGTGAYTVNYSITLPDSNYAATCGGGDFAGGDNICTGILSAGGMGTTSIQLLAGLTGGSGGRRDVGVVCLIVTR